MMTSTIREPRVLTLALNGKYFDEIKAGTKSEEFRLMTPYWRKRLVGRDYDFIELTRGYPKREDRARRLRLLWKGFRETTIVHAHFGEQPVPVFAIDVQTVLKVASDEKWSLNGDNGSWDCDSLAELIQSYYGHDSDGDGHPASYRAGLYEGDTVYRGTVCKDDPAGFLPDASDIIDHMADAAYQSDAGEWADDYPSLDDAARDDLEIALEPLKAWARKHCQPEFFTIKDITPHMVTEEDARLRVTP